MSLDLQIAAQPPGAESPAGVLGQAWHGLDRPAGLPEAVCQVSLRRLLAPAAAGLLETWSLGSAVRSGQLGVVSWQRSESLMFLVVRTPTEADDIAGVTRAAYDALFAAMHAEGFARLVRCWNYLPHINAMQFDPESGSEMERYRLFNRARQASFAAAAQAFEAGAPAACALGSFEGGLTLYALAAREAPQYLENPRQTSAYHYPQQYGPKSPSFSRAALLREGDGRHVLFISGTASIVGHQSLHVGDLAAQTEESLRNIEALVEEANRQCATPGFAMADLHYKVFVRHAVDAANVAAIVRQRTRARHEIVYLHADVCRAELLVEIEAVAFSDAGC